ncbi:alpha/beta hydrolase [Proteobacteria bacterium 005FR1]|nr:alpha/beta hydrolase [Proteobacteria bacterium 005FR1]
MANWQRCSQEVRIPAGEAELSGHLEGPENAMGIVVFVHGSGSSRFSPRNQRVAERLRSAGLATLLFDLLTSDEDILDRTTRAYRFDIDLLSSRLIAVTDWLDSQPATKNMKLGFFGASTGAAAALIAAAHRRERTAAVVSRGGRPDLAMNSLPQVSAPTLLIVGELDTEVIRLNRQAEMALPGECELSIIPGATHLFQEGDTLDQAADLAAQWFVKYMSSSADESGQ